MKRHRLNNGYEIPIIGYGTFPQKGILKQTLPIALEYGYEMIDTSDNYHNEEYVAEGLNEKKNHNVVIISKFSQPDRTFELEHCFEESKKKLNNQLDVYLLHWPYPFLWKIQWRMMEDLYLKGKCRAIGVCNFEKKHLKKLLRSCRVKPMINQFERHPMFQQKATWKFCKKNNIQVISYTPVARMDEKLIKNKVLVDIAKKYHKSVVQVILRWNLQHDCIPIPASTSEKHIRDNICIYDFELSQDDMERIDGLECGYRVRFDPDKRFDKKQKNEYIKIFLKGISEKKK